MALIEISPGVWVRAGEVVMIRRGPHPHAVRISLKNGKAVDFEVNESIALGEAIVRLASAINVDAGSDHD